MTKIQNTKGGDGEGYVRIFGNTDLGQLMSKVHATAIRAGNELEEIIMGSVSPAIITTISDLEQIIDSSQEPPVQIVFKPTKADPDNPKKFIKADFLIVENLQRRFMVIEMKDGNVFDTKKSDGELASLKNIKNWLTETLAYKGDYFICAFNAENKDIIMRGFKNRFSEQHVMTGKEFCNHLGINYDAIRLLREGDQAENRSYFLRKLLENSDICSEIIAILDENKSGN